MRNIEIRKAKYKDIEAIVDINITGWKTAYRGIIDDEFLDSIDRESRIKNRKCSFYQKRNIVAVIDDMIVGYCTYTDEKNKINIFKTDECKEQIKKLKRLNIDCEIQALYVKSDLTHNGIGKELVNYVKEEIKSKFKNKSQIKMIIWCLKENEPAKKFYKRMGGNAVAQRFISIGNKEYKEVGFVFEI